jgi:hypothetical protein
MTPPNENYAFQGLIFGAFTVNILILIFITPGAGGPTNGWVVSSLPSIE